MAPAVRPEIWDFWSMMKIWIVGSRIRMVAAKMGP